MSKITLDVGLAYKIKQALSRNGIPDVADLDWLATGNNIAEVRRVRLGYSNITVLKDVINCDVDPFLPEGWSVEEHQKGGVFKWEPANVALYLSERQKNNNWIEGNKLRRELTNKPVLNANVLDYLVANPHLIPEEWKDEVVFFWGTIYRVRVNDLYVRYLSCRGDDEWNWCTRWLGGSWCGLDPAAVLAS